MHVLVLILFYKLSMPKSELLLFVAGPVLWGGANGGLAPKIASLPSQVVYLWCIYKTSLAEILYILLVVGRIGGGRRFGMGGKSRGSGGR